MKNRLILLLTLLLQTAVALAIKVEGTVLDEMKQPVIGATVQLKGTSNGTITDLNGKFSLKVDRVKEDVLVVSYIGYKNRVVPLKGRTIINKDMQFGVESGTFEIMVGTSSQDGDLKKTTIEVL